MSINTINWDLSVLENITPDTYNSDFLLNSEKTNDQLVATILIAEIFKELHKAGKSFKVFDSGLGISIFRDNSTRTRFSFASAVNALGLGLSELDEVKSQIAHGETVRESANMISFLAQTIGIRDDMYLGEGNKYMQEVSDAVEEGYREGVLHNRPSVINLQCDIDHPTQSLADLLKIKDYFGSLGNMKGKKLAMTWAYSPSYGKPLSVPQAIISLMTRFGMEVTLAYPEGYDLIPEVVEQAKKNNPRFRIVNSMEEAFEGADVVYPKSWAPYFVMQRRTELLKNSDREGLAGLEKECLANNSKYKNWECDDKKMNLTKNRNALYMHCLPADISGVSCKAGEVSKEIFEKYRIHTYQEASFKPFIIAAMIYLTRIQNPIDTLKNLI